MSRMLRIIGIIVLIVVVCAITCIFDYNKNKEIKKKEIREKLNKCEMLDGGGFTLYFESNGGNNIDSMSVCIACSPDSYEELPIPEKTGYIFDGWYYDKIFNNKVDGTSSLNVKPRESKDKKGCMDGYKDITLYAKWKK